MNSVVTAQRSSSAFGRDAPSVRGAAIAIMGLLLALLTSGLVSAMPASAATKVEFWHTFGDAKRSGWIADRAADYNKLHPDTEVVPVFKGDSNQVLQATILSARHSQPTHPHSTRPLRRPPLDTFCPREPLADQTIFSSRCPCCWLASPRWSSPTR